MSLEVIGAGYGRTGTESLQTALETLGYAPCHHMHAIRDSPDLYDDWRSFADGEHQDWDRLFKGFKAQVDFPGAAHWRALCAHFPDAKVILTIRDPEKWADSVEKSVLELLKERENVTDPHLRRVIDLSDDLVGKDYFQGRAHDRTYRIERFKQHTKNVIAEIPSERLLVYQVSQGWEPLCAFLGKPVPEEDFPHSNDRDSFRTNWKTADQTN